MHRHALVVGAQIEGLTGAESDAGRMRDLLIERGFQVELRVGDDASRAGILDGYDALIARTTDGDAAAIYYSGHGLYAIDSAAETTGGWAAVQSIAPSDLRAGGDDDFRGITAWELAIKLAQLTARTRNVTVMLDCCHATQMTRAVLPGDPVARALPHPVRMGFAAHLRALEQRYGPVAVDPIGNPWAVRVVACGQHEPAFEHTNPAGRRAGIFTEALLDALRRLGDAELSWATLGEAIRARVMRVYPRQRPDVEGPAERQPFELAVAPRRAGVRLTRPAATSDAAPPTFELHAGTITGVAVGDRYRVVPLELAVTSDARPATIRVIQAGAMASLAQLEPDSVAPDRVTLDDRGTPAGSAAEWQRGSIDDRGTPAGSAAEWQRGSIDALAIPIGPAAASPAARLLALVGEHGLATASLDLRFGQLVDSAPRPLADHGATLTAGARIYLTAHNLAPHRRYLHVINLGVAGAISLVTKARDPAGIPLEPGARLTLGEHHGRLVGLALHWPAGVDRDAPRLDQLFAIVTAQPTNLRGLEAAAPGTTRDAALPDGVPLRIAFDAFFVRRLSYWLAPR